MSENNAVKLPEVIVFAGPNGSGKTTITGMAKTVGEYINADDIKRTTLCTDIEAAQKAEELREKMISEKRDFTFETVLSTDRNLLLLKKAPEYTKIIFCSSIWFLIMSKKEVMQETFSKPCAALQSLNWKYSRKIRRKFLRASILRDWTLQMLIYCGTTSLCSLRTIYRQNSMRNIGVKLKIM